MKLNMRKMSHDLVKKFHLIIDVQKELSHIHRSLDKIRNVISNLSPIEFLFR